MGKDMTPKFRTIRNLQNYNDDERDFPPSCVDETGYEDINVLVKRLTRGEALPPGRAGSYDGNGSAEELLAKASPLQEDGADLADVGPIVDGIKARQAARKAPKPSKATPPPPPAKEAPKAAGGAGSEAPTGA